MVAHEQKSNQSPGLTYNHHPPVKETGLSGAAADPKAETGCRDKAPGGARKNKEELKRQRECVRNVSEKTWQPT